MSEKGEKDAKELKGLTHSFAAAHGPSKKGFEKQQTEMGHSRAADAGVRAQPGELSRRADGMRLGSQQVAQER
eukprot:5414860-Pyramimonas_sp.AAC.1